MSFENFNNNVIKSTSSASSGAKKKDEETKAPSGGFSNFSKAMGLETKPVVANKPVEQIQQPQLNEAGKKAFYDNPFGTSRLKSSISSQQEPAKETIFDKSLNLVSKVATGIGNFISDQQARNEAAALPMTELMYSKNKIIKTDPISGKKTITTQRLEDFKTATPEKKAAILNEVSQEAPLLKFLNTKTGRAVTGAIYENTSNIPLKAWARVKAIGDDTYDEAYSALLEKAQDPNNSRFTRIMYGLQDSGIQSAIGALLSVGASYISRNPKVGQAVSLAYFAPISAESQRQDNAEGKVTSLGNIAIDTIGDTVISGVAESALKNIIKEGGEAGLKEFAKQVGKGFLVEGTTEPSQTLLKYANDYKNAKTEADRQAVVAKVSEYVKSGGMIDEFLIGGLSGAGITGAATLAGKGLSKGASPSLQPKTMEGGAKKEDEKPVYNEVVGQLDEDFMTIRDQVDDIKQELATNQDDQTASMLGVLQDQLNDYQDAVKKRPVYISDDTQDAPIVVIETVQYPDGKVAAKIDANTEQNGMAKSFEDSQLFDTETQAIEEAKKELVSWAKDTISTDIETAEANKLQNIIDRVETIDKVKQDFKKTTAERVPVTDTESAAKDLIRSYVLRGDSLKSLKDGQGGASSDEYSASIGGYANGKLIGADKIAVTKLNGVELDEPAIFSLTKLYNDIKAEGQEKPKKSSVKEPVAKKEVPETLAEREDLVIKDYFDSHANPSLAGFEMWANSQALDSEEYTKRNNPQYEGVSVEKIIAKYKKLYGNNKVKNASLDEVSKQFLGKPTQKATVEEAVREKPKSIKEVAKETGILEPNVRRILGVGAKDGTFKRVEEGVYVLSNNGEDVAWVETANAVEALPRLVEKGFKADMIFLDIPYDTPAVKGGNRGVEYDLLSLADFSKILDSVKEITQDKNTPVIHMYSQAPSGLKAMQKYNDLFIWQGFKPVGKGQYQKTFADGSPVTSPNGKIAQPEGIMVFTQSGELNKGLKNLNFTLKRPKGYQTEKPAEMLKELIEMTTEQGDTILDPFAGSGVTGAEAIRAGRKAYLIEKNEKVAEEITKPRVEEAVKETKDYADQLAEMTKAGQYGSLFLATEITKKNIRDTTTGKPAPSGVLLGERKLYINREALNKDIEILKSDDPIAIKEADLQEHARKYNENNTDLAQRYLESIISFEENHIKKGTLEEAYSLFTGEGAEETAKAMDQRAIEDEKIKDLSKMTFYHGTTQNFDKFSMDRLGENTGWDNAKFGIFFSDSKDIAYNFANDNRAAGDSNDVIVKEVKLDLKNPIDLTLEGILNKAEQAPTVVKLLGGDDMTEDEAMALLDETIDLGSVSEMYDGLYGDINNKKIMQDAGYDGIISQFGDGILEYVVFDVNQIKDTAIDNTGGSNIIKPYDNIKQKRVSDVSPISDREDRRGGQELAREIPRYDRATMLVESGNGLGERGTNGLTKKDRQLINEQVESLLESKDYSLNQDDYTLADRELMAAYSGAGGKESVGGEGAGLLNEYYTPQIVIDKMWQLAENLMPNAETAFEPSAGTGKIINSSPANINVDGAEISKVSGTIASILNPDSKITIGDFQELFFDKTTNKSKTPPQYDIVIGNPPFGDRAGFLKGKGEEPKINRMEEYFIKRGLDMTKEGGYLIYVVNSSFLKTKSSAGKQAIAKNGLLIEAYRLPENAFEDTTIGTDIVIFRKNTLTNPDITIGDITEDRYFRANPFNVLGETKIRKNKFGKNEEYVTGNLDEAMASLRTAKRTEEQNAPIPYQQYRLTGENSIMEGKSWEEARIIPKEAVKVEATPVTKKELVAKSVTRKADSQTTLPKKNAAKLVIPVQDISNKKKIDPKEVEMLKRIERDMSIPNPTNDETNFLNYENGKYYPDVIYFSGSVYDKIDYLKANKKDVIEVVGEDKYSKQLAGLEAVKPERVALKDISFDPLDRHVANIKTSFERYGNVVEGTVIQAFTNYIKTGRVAFSPRVNSYDVARYVMGEQASKDTKPIMGLIKSDAKRLFNHFLKNELDKDIQKQIEDKYNKEKNSYVRPDYSKIPVAVNDMAKDFRGREFKMSQTQKEGVGFLVNKGSGAIAYGVGVGKTHTLAIATKANLDKGWTKRPLFTVPKSTISKTWIATLHEMFPTLVINNLEGLQAPIVRKLKKERGEDPKNWIKDGEFTVISHEGLLRLGFKEDELRESAGDLQDALWQEPTTKRAGEKSKEKYDEILGNAQKYVTDIMLSDLGFDHISVDEVHNFRKIFQGAKPENVDEDGKAVGKKRFGNVIGGTPSKRAQQLFLITQHIQKKYNNRNVFLASATPFENHATEVYNILSLVARDRMNQMGILNINDFFSTFANFEVELDRKLNGEWLNREKMKSFANLQALQSLIKEFIDYQEDQTLVRPDRRVITPTLQMSDKQIDNLAKIQDLLNGVSTDATTEGLTKGEVEDGAFLKASTYSIANSVSPYFIKEYVGQAPTIEKLVEESPKIKYTLEAIKTLKADSKTKDFGSFVFFGKMGVEYHPALAEYFANYLGYKKSEVAFLSGNVTDDQKETIKEKFNNGEIKVLLGGDQTKEGIDLQNNGYATFNLALGWNPTQIQQVEGRVWRQGNKRNIAPLIYPLVENSGDAMIYNKFEEKGGRINDLFSYAGTMFDVGEIDPAEKKLSLLTDPQDKARMQIEIDKVALYNERVMVDNDLKDLAKIQTDINDATGNIKYYKEEIADEYNSDERKATYKKELKRYTEKLERLEAKLKSKNVKDLDEAIAKFQTDIDNIDLKIKGINETLPAVLERFTKEYQEQIKLRKTLAEQMDEIKGLIAETSERTPEEIDALRNKKIAELEAKRLDLPENIAYQGGGTNASIGLYRDGTPVELGSLDSIRPIEMPELVRLARELTGSTPKVKAKLNSKLGLFKPKTGEIYLKADQFVQGNEQQLAKLLAHEIGHVTDWLPDKSMARGNLLGRIFSLKKFLSSTFSKETGEALDTDAIRTQAFKEILAENNIRYGDYLTQRAIREQLKPLIKARYTRLIDETGAIRNNQVKAELQAVSEYWRPYDKDNSSANYIQYRNSAAELYADAISVLFNSPGTLERMAPTFYTEFFDALDNKPEFKASFFELQELLNGSSEEIFKARKESIRTGFEKAEAIQADFAAKKKMATKSYFGRLRQQLDDINYPITKKQREAEANGAIIDETESPRFLLQEESFIDNENFLLIEDIDTNVVKPIESAGMIIDDLGEYLLLSRIQNDRADIANPYGFNKENSGTQLEYLKQTVGEDNFALLEEKAQFFHDLVFKSVEEAVRVGSYNKETFETKIKPNKDTYASFQVVDYMQDYMPATIKAQVGTLKEVANPFVSTILKTVALNRLNAHQRAKNGTVKLLKDNFPEDITETKRITSDGKLTIFKPAKDRGALQLLEDGKMQSYDVDPYIAESFTHDKAGDLNAMVSLLDKFNNKLFKPLVTTYNLGFAAAFNPIRDFKRNYKNIGNATVYGLLKSYVKSLPSAVRYSKGQLDDFTRSLVESKAINAPINDYNFDPREDELGRILERYGLIKKDEPITNRSVKILRKTLLKPVVSVLEGVRFISNTFEIVSKVAGAKVRIAGGEGGKQLAYNLRNYTGTPNYKVKGLQTNTTNAIFVFSNIMKEGLKSDYQIATNPKTRSGYWWKTVKVDVLPKLLMFLASAGLLGELLKEFYDDVSEYDKTNYIILPLGWYNIDDKDFSMLQEGDTDVVGRKAVYMRIPHDETGRLISASFWKMANMIKDGGNANDLQGIFALGAGQLPSVTPALTVAGGWIQYLSGKNPYDEFRGRAIIDDTTFAAGGMPALKKMVQWSTNSIGLTKFATFDKSKQGGLETAMQVAPFFSSVFKISNYGQQEKLKEVGKEAKQEAAQKSLADRELIAKYVKQARADKSTLFAATKYRNDLIAESLGGRMPQSAEEAKTADALVAKFKRSLKRGLNDDPRVDTIISAVSNAEKKAIIEEIKADMNDSEFATFRQGLLEDKIVTPELMYSIK